MQRIIIGLILVFASGMLHAQPKREVRAAWVTTAYSLDWPRAKATTPAARERQKAELTDLLDRLKAANFNTVLFQARTRGEVFYRSAIEPYSAELTGKAGKDPGYDPLAFAVEECHKRGMECHAWLVSIPLGGRKHAVSLGKQGVTQRNPSICVSHKNEWFLNPAHPQTKQYLGSIVNEIVKNYDIDGIHLDYHRYPENTKFPDSREFRNQGGGKSLDQWRRDNLTEILRHIYAGVKESKPWVKVSTSPVGKYRDTSRYASRGWNAYHTVYQDVKQWLAEGIQDQVYPMMYFRRDHFYPFALDWQEESNGRHIVPGLGIYFLHPKEGNWKRHEVERQIHFLRRNGLAGEAYYRAEFLMDNTQDLYQTLCEEFYPTPALQPEMPWLDNVAPSAPSEIEIENNGGYVTFRWKAATDNDSHNAPRYVLYGSDTYPVDVSKAENLLATYIQGTEYTYAPLFPWERKLCYALTAIDRYGNESEPAEINSWQ